MALRVDRPQARIPSSDFDAVQLVPGAAYAAVAPREAFRQQPHAARVTTQRQSPSAALPEGDSGLIHTQAFKEPPVPPLRTSLSDGRHTNGTPGNQGSRSAGALPPTTGGGEGESCSPGASSRGAPQYADDSSELALPLGPPSGQGPSLVWVSGHQQQQHWQQQEQQQQQQELQQRQQRSRILFQQQLAQQQRKTQQQRNDPSTPQQPGGLRSFPGSTPGKQTAEGRMFGTSTLRQNLPGGLAEAAARPPVMHVRNACAPSPPSAGGCQKLPGMPSAQGPRSSFSGPMYEQQWQHQEQQQQQQHHLLMLPRTHRRSLDSALSTTNSKAGGLSEAARSLADELAMYEDDSDNISSSLAEVKQVVAITEKPKAGSQLHSMRKLDGEAPYQGQTLPPRNQRSLSREPSAGEERCNGADCTFLRKGQQTQCRVFERSSLEAATGNWSAKNIVGKGRYGTVYVGRVAGCQVAVKRLDAADHNSDKEYRAEVEVLSRVRHPHVILLMGHCPQTSSLVYEYMPGGSLQDYLVPGVKRPLTWCQRIKVLEHVASALTYLHNFEPPIVHRDLKPQNVMLDGSCNAKLGDAGLARLLEDDDDSITCRVSGTFGYIDPEMMTNLEVSATNDVYAFGVICLQLLTGEHEVARIHKTINSVGSWGSHKTAADRTVEAFLNKMDPAAGAWPADVALQLARIGVQCSSRKQGKRLDLTTEVLPALSSMGGTDGGDVSSSGAVAPVAAVQAQLVCPLSKVLMSDPVVAADGFTYERHAIEAWQRQCDQSPVTGDPFLHKELMPNNSLRKLLKPLG